MPVALVTRADAGIRLLAPFMAAIGSMGPPPTLVQYGCTRGGFTLIVSPITDPPARRV